MLENPFLSLNHIHTQHFYECVNTVVSCSPSRSDYTVSATYRQIHNCWTQTAFISNRATVHHNSQTGPQILKLLQKTFSRSNTHWGPFRNNSSSVLTLAATELVCALTLALVRASGSPHIWQRRLMNGWSGIRTPMSYSTQNITWYRRQTATEDSTEIYTQNMTWYRRWTAKEDSTEIYTQNMTWYRRRTATEDSTEIYTQNITWYRRQTATEDSTEIYTKYDMIPKTDSNRGQYRDLHA